MKYCATILKSERGEKPCGNRVLPFVDAQPADQCFRCYETLEGPSYDAGSNYKDPNDGGVPK